MRGDKERISVDIQIDIQKDTQAERERHLQREDRGLCLHPLNMFLLRFRYNNIGQWEVQQIPKSRKDRVRQNNCGNKKLQFYRVLEIAVNYKPYSRIKLSYFNYGQWEVPPTPKSRRGNGARGTDVDGLTFAVHGIGIHGAVFRNGDIFVLHLKYKALQFKRVRVLNSKKVLKEKQLLDNASSRRLCILPFRTYGTVSQLSPPKKKKKTSLELRLEFGIYMFRYVFVI